MSSFIQKVISISWRMLKWEDLFSFSFLTFEKSLFEWYFHFRLWAFRLSQVVLFPFSSRRASSFEFNFCQTLNVVGHWEMPSLVAIMTMQAHLKEAFPSSSFLLASWRAKTSGLYCYIWLRKSRWHSFLSF